MKVEDFIGCTLDELLATKRNSFSRNIIEQNKDLQQHEEILRFNTQGITGELSAYLFICKNMTIHAIDEKQSPVPFSFLENVYENSSFILQHFSYKKAYVLTMFRNADGGNDIGSFFVKTYHNGTNTFKSDKGKGFSESFLDFGFVKCAMTLDKTYGIQDLLEVAWQELQKCAKRSDSVKVVRFIFSVDQPRLSTITLYSDDSFILAGRTKIVDSECADKISQALDELSQCKYVQQLIKSA